MRAPNSEAQQRRTASSVAAAPRTLSIVSFMPAKLADSVSSAVAEERTATAISASPPARRSCASRTASASHSGSGSASTSARTSWLARSSAAVSSTSTAARRRSIRSRSPPASQKAA